MTQLSVHKYYKRAKTRKIHSVFFCPFINENFSFCECFKGRATVMIVKINFYFNFKRALFLCMYKSIKSQKYSAKKRERNIYKFGRRHIIIIIIIISDWNNFIESYKIFHHKFHPHKSHIHHHRFLSKRTF